MTARRLPMSVYNWTTMIGAATSVVSFSIIVLLLLIDYFVQETTIYLGILSFVVLPIFLVLGLILIAVGILLERRRRARGTTSSFPTELFIDLHNTSHRNTILIFVLGSAIFLLSSTIGIYKAYKETESVEFCGTVCHTVMKPEYTTYLISPHARVSCAECHIGEGAGWYVQSKLSGAYQVYAALANNYPRPIPTPIENLRPARETCEQCHWPEQFFEARQDVNHHFLGDEENTPVPLTMLIKIGGNSKKNGKIDGVHWHVAEENKVEYIARDKQELDIAWVRLTNRAGKVVEYNNTENPLSPTERATAQIRTMDCMDCHNRPSHNYRSPNRTVNEALALGRVDRNLPYIKMQALTALDAQYPDTPTALQRIEKKLTQFYQEEYPEVFKEQRTTIDSAVAVVQQIYQQNFFPEMKVTWRKYPDHIGHSEFIGCFRCHGSSLKTEEELTITKDCSTCHTILNQGAELSDGLISVKGLDFFHPEDIDGEEFESNCTECHEGGAEIY